VRISTTAILISFGHGRVASLSIAAMMLFVFSSIRANATA
jgi:hypothetical protein